MAGRIEFVLDFGCGTATSAALYYLLFYPKCHVIGYDKYCTEEWVRSHLPELVQWHFHFVGSDCEENSNSISQATQKTPKILKLILF